MEIKNVTINDFEAIKSAFHRNFFKNKVVLRVSIFFLLIVLYFVFNMVIFGFDLFWLFNIFFVFLFFTVLLLLRWFITPKIAYKKTNANFKNRRNTFVFNDDKINIASITATHNDTSEFAYDAIVKVYENAEYIYLYVTARRAYLLNKKGFESGTALDLRNLLQTKLPSIKYKYSRELKDK